MDDACIEKHNRTGKRARAKDGEPMKFLLETVNTEQEDCIFWPYSRLANGYAVVRFEGKTKMTHRLILAMRLKLEEPAPIIQTRHLCGNGHLGCVNPKHLAFGTHKENSLDRKIHGTQTYGEESNNSKLTSDQVRSIRKETGTLREIAEKYGCDMSNIGYIKRRDTWNFLK